MKRKTLAFLLAMVLLLSSLSSCMPRKRVPPGAIIERVSFGDYEQQWLVQNINAFSARSVPLIFADEKDQNMLYSPASLYLALSMLYEFSKEESETREEILALIQPVEQGDQAALCDALYRNMVFRSQPGKLKTGNSIWAAANVAPYLPENTLQTIEKFYHGAVFTTDMSDAGEMEKWISKMTEGEISHVPGGLDPDAGLVILNSTLFQDEWDSAFSDDLTKQDIFYLANTNEISCNFMQGHESNKEFILTDTFSAARLYFKSGFQMHFILPAEGLLPGDLLKDTDIFHKATDYSPDNDSREMGEVNYKIPKVKFTSEMDLVDVMKQLGIKKAFIPTGDFPAMLSVTAINQDTKFDMDEKGAKAVAVTKIELASGAPQPSKNQPSLDLILDRPFLFLIASPEGYVVFAGVVNNPALES